MTDWLTVVKTGPNKRIKPFEAICTLSVLLVGKDLTPIRRNTSYTGKEKRHMGIVPEFSAT